MADYLDSIKIGDTTYSLLGRGYTINDDSGFQIGTEAVATGFESFAGGYVTASGSRSFAYGYNSTSSGNWAFTTGMMNTGAAATSFVLGMANYAGGSSSAVFGNFNVTNVDNTFVLGMGNKDVKDSILMIGMGTLDNDSITDLENVLTGKNILNPKNALTIMSDGKHYILDVGSYDGTNEDSATDLATVLNNILTRLNALDGLGT